jgi:hypothetical protein
MCINRLICINGGGRLERCRDKVWEGVAARSTPSWPVPDQGGLLIVFCADNAAGALHLGVWPV